ncbi:MAG: ROK family transcriptional regulator [Pseudomonadota bacterium]
MKGSPVTMAAAISDRPSASTRGSNQMGVRAHNERLVLTLVRRSGPLAKSEISRITGLSAQSVSVIMRALEGEGLLRKGEPKRGKVGQPSVPINLNPDGAFFFGLKVGRRSSDLILVDFAGDVVARLRHAHPYPDPDDVLRFAVSGVERLTAGLSSEQRERVTGLGVALPFRMWEWADHLGVDEAVLSGWRDRDVADELSKHLSFPVHLSNDATAACGAELVFGDQDKPREFLYFYVGFFIGGGLVLDNALYSGPTSNAAALGSMPVSIEGERARHLVDVASLSILADAVEAAGAAELMEWEEPTRWRIPPDIRSEWMERAASGIAQAALSAASLIDFGCVVLDGWMPADMRADLVRLVNARIAEIRIEGIEKPSVRAGAVGPDARALGAASLPLSERFLVDRSAFSKG